jgi:hypothetical protein
LQLNALKKLFATVSKMDDFSDKKNAKPSFLCNGPDFQVSKQRFANSMQKEPALGFGQKS